jgi:hypothetical protein
MQPPVTIEEANSSPKTQVAGLGTKGIFSSLVQMADREFLASAKLLAERARFVTGASGVAVAFEEDGRFIYRVLCGNSGHGPGTPVNLASKAVRQCIENRQTTRGSTSIGDNTSFALCVPILERQYLAGFFEVSAGHDFSDNDIQTVTRLAEIIITALEHQEAARSTESQLLTENQLLNESMVHPVPDNPGKPEIPTLWHAEGQAPSLPEVEQPALPITSVSACRSCGFPVSPGRLLCLDCEARLPSPDFVPKNEMFSKQPQESWISAHGYTIASLIVTALAAAIIYWLR